MIFIRNLTARTQAIKTMAVRQMSTNPQRIAPFSVGSPLLRNEVPPSSSFATTSVTTSPAYDIKESPFSYEVSLKMPSGMKSENLAIDVEQGAGAFRVSGGADDVKFAKRFSLGGVLDIERLTTTLNDGFLVIQAPKIHHLNGNSPLLGTA